MLVALVALCTLLGRGTAAVPAARVLQPPADADQLLVQPRAGVALGALHDALAADGYTLRPAPAGAGAVRVVVPPGADPRALATRIAVSGLARSVEADDRVVATRRPNDPRYLEQADALGAIHAPAAWDLVTGDPRVTIAIVDSGIDLTHPDLAGRLATNAADPIDGLDNDGNGCVDDGAGCNFVSLETADPSCNYTLPPPNRLVDDDEGHGSFVGGIAAAAGNDGVGITGVAWNVRLLAVKVLDCTATGRIADAAAGIRYAVQRGADVINISFGSRRDSAVLGDAVAEALAAGAVVVASAGNDGADIVTFPAAYPGVIAVAASGRAGSSGIDYQQQADYSNFGGRVDLLAPGSLLLSTVPPELCGRRGWTCRNGPYAVATGTSFAAPIVAGAAALLRSQRPGVRPELVRSVLVATAAPTASSRGLLDLAAALARPVFSTGLPGTSRGSGGTPPGPAEPGGAAQPDGLPAPPPPRAPIPANTGYGPGEPDQP